MCIKFLSYTVYVPKFPKVPGALLTDLPEHHLGHRSLQDLCLHRRQNGGRGHGRQVPQFLHASSTTGLGLLELHLRRRCGAEEVHCTYILIPIQHSSLKVTFCFLEEAHLENRSEDGINFLNVHHNLYHELIK